MEPSLLQPLMARGCPWLFCRQWLQSLQCQRWYSKSEGRQRVETGSSQAPSIQ